MKDEFRNIYSNLFSDYYNEFNNPNRLFYRDFEYDLLIQTRRAIDKFEHSKLETLPIRSDAKYFLALNFHHMIIKPILEYIKFRHAPLAGNMSKLSNEVENDISQILNASIERLDTEGEEKRTEVSAHLIMEVIDDMWEELKLTRFEIWND